MTTSSYPLTAKQKKQTTKQDLLTDCLTKSPFLKDEEINAITGLFHVQTFKKGTLLLSEGEVSNICYYNFKGCVRQFYLKNGEEYTTFFYTEDQSITTNVNDNGRMPSKFYLECTEETTLSIITNEQERELYRRFPRIESLCRIELEKRLYNYQTFFATHFYTTPEERYMNLLETQPSLLQRVPQHQIASYLGIKPESLSRIRKRIANKS